jgi:hypothetical protein
VTNAARKPWWAGMLWTWRWVHAVDSVVKNSVIAETTM